MFAGHPHLTRTSTVPVFLQGGDKPEESKWALLIQEITKAEVVDEAVASLNTALKEFESQLQADVKGKLSDVWRDFRRRGPSERTIRM
jgi:hypothetical protein